MLKEVRELEKELKLEPIHIDVFGNDVVARAKAIKWYLIDLNNLRQEKKRKEKEHG